MPAEPVPGEQACATQPFSVAAVAGVADAARPRGRLGNHFWDRGSVATLIASTRNEGIFTPPDRAARILSPGYLGGVNWGGIVFDEQRQRVIAAVNHLPMVVTL